MRRHELSFEEEERFSRLSELPELLERLGVGISGDSVMEALGWTLFAGAFDPPDKPAAPARYAYDAWARVQTLAVPVMTLMRLRLLKHGCSEFSGNRYRYASRRHAAWMLAQAKLLPIEARHCESPAELDAICGVRGAFLLGCNQRPFRYCCLHAGLPKSRRPPGCRRSLQRAG